MGGNKFMVFKLKEVLKTAVFAVLGVLIIIAIIYFLVPKGDKTALYHPGVYTASVILGDELVQVEVSVDEYEIKEVSLVHTAETVPVFYPLFESTMDTVAKEIVKCQSLDISIPDDASVTAKVILDAVADGLSQAEIK